MDPALWELLRSGVDDANQEVEAIVRLGDPQVDVTGVRVVSRFGPIATCRLRRDSILRTRRDDNVVSLKAPRTLGPEYEPNMAAAPIELLPDVVDSDLRRPPHLPLTGAGVCVGIVDWGCDFDHPNFKRPDGATRLLALWDQRGRISPGSPRPYGYGVLYGETEINGALRTANPYEALGYHPAEADRDGFGAHGTACMDIAAGNGLAGSPSGIASEADLIFVHLADRGTGGLANLGDSVRILEAVDFIARTAGRRPWVINLSVGRHGGPHDGCTLTELALDFTLDAAPGRFIVQSTGNYFAKSIHASGRLRRGQVRTLTVITNEADVTPNELEVWYSGQDEFVVEIESPTGQRSPSVGLGEQAIILEDDTIVGRIYHRFRDPNNSDNDIELFLYPSAPAGSWIVTLRAKRVRNGAYHAWLERDEVCPHCQARFKEGDADRSYTTGTIANGRLPLVVGAYDAHSPGRELAPFSSAGPTRDYRPKPDLVAPGVRVLAARSAPPGTRRSPGLQARKDGTSFAAPQVAGTVALCLQGAPRPLRSEEIRALLLSAAQPVSSNRNSSPRFGAGYLDVGNVVAAVSALGRAARPARARGVTSAKQRESDSKELKMRQHSQKAIAVSLGPNKLYRDVAYGRGRSLRARIDESFVVLALPGESPNAPPAAGDVLVRIALGEPDLGHVAVLSDSPLMPREALATAHVTSESEGPGLYAIVIEEGAFPHTGSDRFARRVLDRAGRMPLGQVLLRPKPPLDADQNVRELDQDVADQGHPPDPLTAPLADAEWRGLYVWLSRGEVGLEPLTADASHNADLVAAAIFCGRLILSPDFGEGDPLLCVVPDVTAQDVRVQALKREVTGRGPIIHWPAVSTESRLAYVMNLLVDKYHYPVYGAAGIVGNLYAESRALPSRIEGSAAVTPMRAANFAGRDTDFDPDEVMNRSRVANPKVGPLKPGVGLAQWTVPARRSGLFNGNSSILFNMDGQVEYLVGELRGNACLNASLTAPGVTVNDASDDFVYRFEIPRSILDAGRHKRPRGDPAVQKVFKERRAFARRALAAFQAAHPAPAVAPALPPAKALGEALAEDVEEGGLDLEESPQWEATDLEPIGEVEGDLDELAPALVAELTSVPARVDLAAGVPPFVPSIRERIDLPLLDSKKSRVAVAWNQTQHPASSGVPITDIREALAQYVDFAAIQRAIDEFNSAHVASSIDLGTPPADAVFVEAIHQFQRKCYSDSGQHDGLAGESTLDSFGLIVRTGHRTVNRANVGALRRLKDREAQDDVRFNEEFTASSWFDQMVNPAFLGQTFREGIHLHLLRRLRAGERHLLSLPRYRGMTPVALGSALAISEQHRGARPSATTASMHTFGLAVDISYTANPWVRRPASWRVLQRAALLVSGTKLREAKASAYFHSLGSDTTRSTGDVWDELRRRHDELLEYFRIATDDAGLDAVLRAHQATGTAGVIATGETLAGASLHWRNRMRQDLQDLTSGDFRGHDPPTNGFLHLPRDLVIALRDHACLIWGAVDIGPDPRDSLTGSGDVMHFDARMDGVGAVVARGVNFIPQAGHPCLRDVSGGLSVVEEYGEIVGAANEGEAEKQYEDGVAPPESSVMPEVMQARAAPKPAWDFEDGAPELHEALDEAGEQDVKFFGTDQTVRCLKGEYPVRDEANFVREIRSIMAAKGWDVAAWLQTVWANSTANQLVGKASDGMGTDGPLAILDVSIDWALAFERARSLYLELGKPSVFANEKARRVLQAKIERKFQRTASHQVKFGNLSAKGRTLEDEYVNFRGISMWSAYKAGVDALAGALGRFTMYVIPSGAASRKGGKTSVLISNLGIYLRDSYDFNGEQFLGYWRKPDEATLDAPPAHRVWGSPRCSGEWFEMSNAAFRGYRKRTGLGQDFLVYSDVKIVHLANPVTFDY